MSGKKPKKKAAGGESKKKKDAKGGSPGGGAKGDDKARQLQQAAAELVLARGRVAALEAEQRDRDEELAAVRARQEADSLTYGDVLHHQQREQEGLVQHARDLEQRLEAAQAALAGVQAELRAAQEAAAAEEEAEDASGYKRLMSSARKKDDMIAQQEAELAALRVKLQDAHESLFEAFEQIESLKCKASSRAQLLFLFDEHCLARIDRHRLTGRLPPQHPGHVLCCTGGRWLLQYGTAPAAAAGNAASSSSSLETVVQMLDLHSGQWQAPASQPCRGGEALVGHAAVAAKNRLVAFGGSSGEGMLSGPRVFSPDALGWVELPHLAGAGAPAPCAREGHAMAYCSRTNAMYLFGGKAESAQLMNDLWRLRMDTQEWTQLECRPAPRNQDHPPAGGKAPMEEDGLPKPCCNAALAVSEDGMRLWLSGGSTASGQCQSTLWRYEVDSCTWSLTQPVVDSLYVEPREGHVMTCVRRWLLVAGGSCLQSTGERRQLADTLVFDTVVSAWDCLDSTAWAAPPDSRPVTSRSISLPQPGAGALGTPCGGSSSARRGSSALGSAVKGLLAEAAGAVSSLTLSAANCTFVGSSLLLLKPNAAGLQDELQVVHLSLLDEVARRRKQKRASLIVIEHLELVEMAVTATSISLAWVVPTKNAHKLVGFKLMLTDRDGSVKEVYQGKERTCELEKLTPGTEYILALKATYDDASFVWSESKAVTTLGKAGKT